LYKEINMPNFFDTAPGSHWREVPLPEVPVAPFLDAALYLTRIFDAFGSLALLPVKNDLLKNITTLREASQKAPLCRTMSQLLVNEKMAGRTTGECAITSYIWLVRGLELISATFMRWVDVPSEELKTCFNVAYGQTLYKHHTWVQYGAFQMALMSIPTSAYFFTRLGNPPPYAIVEYFSAMKQVLSLLPSV
jgi:hypothetical protein